MVVDVVTVPVKAEHVQDVIAATLENHRARGVAKPTFTMLPLLEFWVI